MNSPRLSSWMYIFQEELPWANSNAHFTHVAEENKAETESLWDPLGSQQFEAAWQISFCLISL